MLEHKIDFMVTLEVKEANANGVFITIVSIKE